MYLKHLDKKTNVKHPSEVNFSYLVVFDFRERMATAHPEGMAAAREQVVKMTVVMSSEVSCSLC